MFIARGFLVVFKPHRGGMWEDQRPLNLGEITFHAYGVAKIR